MTDNGAGRARQWVPRLWLGYALLWVGYVVLSFALFGGPSTPGHVVQMVLGGVVAIIGLVNAWQIRNEDNGSP